MPEPDRVRGPSLAHNSRNRLFHSQVQERVIPVFQVDQAPGFSQLSPSPALQRVGSEQDRPRKSLGSAPDSPRRNGLLSSSDPSPAGASLRAFSRALEDCLQALGRSLLRFGLT